MIQDVKLGTHRIGTYMYAISKCAFLLGFLRRKSNNVGVERGVATRRAQMVWPMMTVTVINFEGFTRLKNLQICVIFVRNSKWIILIVGSFHHSA